MFWYDLSWQGHFLKLDQPQNLTTIIMASGYNLRQNTKALVSANKCQQCGKWKQSNSHLKNLQHNPKTRGSSNKAGYVTTKRTQFTKATEEKAAVLK